MNPAAHLERVGRAHAKLAPKSRRAHAELAPSSRRAHAELTPSSSLALCQELSDNFCFYEPNYDSLEGAAGWARDSLALHASDPREHLYSLAQLEDSQTHEDIWNAAQTQLVRTGKMHGFMRMYWAKKVLEWSPDAAEALRRAIHLNDKYSLDGRDPNGYVGCAWSVMGTHDMGWVERAIFGKIRFMNYMGCKRKFELKTYVAKWGAGPAKPQEPPKKKAKKS